VLSNIQLIVTFDHNTSILISK